MHISILLLSALTITDCASPLENYYSNAKVNPTSKAIVAPVERNVQKQALEDVIRRRAPLALTWFKHTIDSRKLPYNTTTLKALEDSIPRTHDAPWRNSTIEPRATGFTIALAMQSCCECSDYRMNCPICMTGSTYICERPYHSFSPRAKDWFHDVFRPTYEQLSSTPTSQVTEHFAWLTFYGGPGYIAYGARSKCDYVPRTSRLYITGQISSECTHVYGPDGACPTASIHRSYDGCDWKLGLEAALDFNLKMCYAPMVATVTYATTRDHVGDGFCTMRSGGGFFIQLPGLLDFIRDRKTYNPSSRPNPLGIIDDSYHFKIEDDSDYLNLFDLLSAEIHPPTNLAKRPARVSCSGDHPNAAYNGKPSVIGDIFLHPPCSSWVPYDSTRYICLDAMVTKFPYCPSLLYKDMKTPSIAYSVPVDEIKLHPEYNVTCGIITKLGKCMLEDLLNSTVQNYTDQFSRIVNNTMDSFAVNFLDILGRNDTPAQFAYSVRHTNGTIENRTVGNWFTSIFGALIAPFFHAFIEIVLSTIINPILEALIFLIKDLAYLIGQLADEIKLVVDALADAFCQLLLILYNVTVGLILQIEARILLFEYVVLFLTIMARFDRGWVFALTIVGICMMIFPFERRHPSVIISLINPDYVKRLNFSALNRRKYNYEYSMAWTTDTSRVVYYFHNDTRLETPL